MSIELSPRIDLMREPSVAEQAIYGGLKGDDARDKATYDALKANELENAKETGLPVFWSQSGYAGERGDTVLILTDGSHAIGMIDVDYSDGCDVYIGDAETARRVNEEALTLESAHELAVALATGGDLSRWVDEN